MKKLIPADTVDAEGNVWETIGENIRHGAKEYSESAIKEIVDIMFPVSSLYCGENNFILSVGRWETLKDGNFKPLLLSAEKVSGTRTSTNIAGPEAVIGVNLRIWKRVE